MLQQAVQANDGAAASTRAGPAGSPEPRPVRQRRLHADELAVGTTESTWFLSSCSNPFMAERPRMRAITPRAIPMRREAEMKAMKPVATAGAAVTQAQEQGQRFEHQATSAMMPLTRVTRRWSLAARLKSWVTTTNAVPSSRLSSHKAHRRRWRWRDPGCRWVHPPAPGWVR